MGSSVKDVADAMAYAVLYAVLAKLASSPFTLAALATLAVSLSTPLLFRTRASARKWRRLGLITAILLFACALIPMYLDPP